MANVVKTNLTELQLSIRLRRSRQTLKNWRVLGKGPEYIKPEGRTSPVLYPLSKVEEWENNCMRRHTSDPGLERDLS